jgi:hypothetical protein
MAEAFFNDVFGRLEWDGQLGGWLGGIDWPPGLHTEVVIWLPGDGVAGGLRVAGEGLEWLKAHEGQARRCAAEEMLAVYNEARQGAGGPLTAAELFRLLKLVRIGLEEDGSLLLTYDAGVTVHGPRVTSVQTGIEPRTGRDQGPALEWQKVGGRGRRGHSSGDFCMDFSGGPRQHFGEGYI